MIELKNEGVIVNIFLIFCVGNMGQVNYLVVKVGVVVDIVVWVKELVCYGICVVGVVLGFIEIEMIVGMKFEVLEKMIVGIFFKCMGKLVEIVYLVVYIFENDYYIGCVFELDGGLCLQVLVL